jgi:transketolase C-terminal domain/subunit
MEARRALWARRVTLRGKGDELLERYQQQHRVPTVLENLATDLTDTARLVEASTARSVNAGLGLITVLGLPFGLAYAGGAVFTTQSPTSFLICTGVGAAMGGLLLAAFPPLRRMIDALRTGSNA